MIVIVMGVSGTGKTTLGREVATRLDWDFIEGDDYHPEANIEKMRSGIPLNDDDRGPWLERLNKRLNSFQHEGKSVVLACSALKERYRQQLNKGLMNVRYIFLYGDSELIRQRLDARNGHFMPSKLLESQMTTLEPPKNAILIPIHLTTEVQAGLVIEALDNKEQS